MRIILATLVFSYCVVEAAMAIRSVRRIGQWGKNAAMVVNRVKVVTTGKENLVNILLINIIPRMISEHMAKLGLSMVRPGALVAQQLLWTIDRHLGQGILIVG